MDLNGLMNFGGRLDDDDDFDDVVVHNQQLSFYVYCFNDYDADDDDDINLMTLYLNTLDQGITTAINDDFEGFSNITDFMLEIKSLVS